MFFRQPNRNKEPLLKATSVVIALWLIGAAFVVGSGHEARALSLGGGTPFGGLSTFVFYCTCSGNIALTITDLAVPTGGVKNLIYEPGATTLYQFYQIYREGVWTLGLWSPGGVCTYYVGKGCMVYPTVGTMTMVGTSM